jgi:hypothetical protein
MKRTIHAGLCAAALSCTGPALANQTYGFDTGYEGWSVTGGGDSAHQASGGNPGGHIEITDVTSEDFTLVAPGSALGNWQSYVGGTLSFDVKNLSGHSADWEGFGIVSFSNGGNTLSLDTVTAANFLPADGQWHTFSVALTPALWGPTLTQVFSHVSDWRIDVEPHFGVIETVGVDNIRLTGVSPVPELDSWAYLLAGMGGLAAWSHSRRTAVASAIRATA